MVDPFLKSVSPCISQDVTLGKGRSENWRAVRCVSAALFAVLMLAVAGSTEGGVVKTTPGIITIPTARFVQDGDLVFGAGYLPPRYAILRDPDFGDQIFYLTVGFLPFVESTWGVVRSENVGKRWGIGDRIVHFRFKLTSEKRHVPALVIGLHDPLGFIGETHAQHFNATYLVASKSFLWSAASGLRLHLGYGGDWIPAAQHQFVGFFGGFEVKALPHSSLLFEYDAEKFNAGVRVDVLRNVQGTISLYGLDRFGGGINYRIRI